MCRASYLKVVFIFSILLLLCSCKIMAGVIEWSVEVENQERSDDIGNAITVDNEGNCYIVGTLERHNKDVYIGSWDRNGNYRWEDRQSNWSDQPHEGLEITLGSNNIVYIASERIYPDYPFHTNFWLNGYNLEGDVVYSRRIPENGGDERATVKELDYCSTSGVVMLGEWSGDWITRQFQTNLIPIGNMNYFRPIYDESYRSVDMVIDNECNIIECGRGHSSLGGSFEPVIVKYNNNVQEIDHAFLTGNPNQTDIATSVTVDDLNNIYVTGYFRNDNGNERIFTAKYNSSLNRQWLHDITSEMTRHFNSEPVDILTDNVGNVYVCGDYVENSGEFTSIVLVKYNPNGFEWYRTYYTGTSSCRAKKLGIDSENNIFIIAETYNSVSTTSNSDVAVIQYSQSGSFRDEIFWDGHDDTEDVMDAFTTPDGIVYITGATDTDGSNFEDIFVVKIDMNEEEDNNYLDIVAPSNGEVWTIGSIQTIEWDVNIGFLDYAVIQISYDGGSNWNTIRSFVPPEDIPIPFSYDWTVEGIASSDCYIRLIVNNAAYAPPRIGDEFVSDQFTIEESFEYDFWDINILGMGQSFNTISFQYFPGNNLYVDNYELIINGENVSPYLKYFDQTRTIWLPMISFLSTTSEAKVDFIAHLNNGESNHHTVTYDINPDYSFPQIPSYLPIGILEEIFSEDYSLPFEILEALNYITTILDIFNDIQNDNEEIALAKTLDEGFSKVPGLNGASYTHNLLKGFLLTDIDCRDLEQVHCDYIKEGFLISDFYALMVFEYWLMIDIATLKMGWGPNSGFGENLGVSPSSPIIGMPDFNYQTLQFFEDFGEQIRSVRNYFDHMWESVENVFVIHGYSPIDIRVMLNDSLELSKDRNTIENSLYEEREVFSKQDWEEQLIILKETDGVYEVEIIYEDNATPDSSFSLTIRNGEDTIKTIQDIVISQYSNDNILYSTLDTGSIIGVVSLSESGVFGTPITLFNYIGEVEGSAYTDENGGYEFTGLDNAEYTVAVTPPLGFSCVNEFQEVTVRGLPVEVNFELVEGVSDKTKHIWWWKYYLSKLADDPKYEAKFTIRNIDEWSELIYDHFYSRSDEFAIPIDNCTYTGNPAMPLNFDKMVEIIVNEPEKTYEVKARKYLLTVMLNIASGRLSQTKEATHDGATVAQALTHLSQLYMANQGEQSSEETVALRYVYTTLKYILNDELIPAGKIPLSTPNVLYKDGEGSPDNSILPSEFALNQNYPNPFNPVTEISFALPNASDVKLEVYNIIGQKVATLADGYYDVGTHIITWDATNMASGMYLYRIETGDFIDEKKMVLLK